MEEKLYQNIDVPQQNPLETVSEITTSTPKKLNPKIIFVISLLSIVFVLFLISLFVSQKRSINSTQSTPSPTQTPSNNSTINDSLIPTQYQKNFKEIEQSLSQDPDLPIPQIDTEVGL